MSEALALDLHTVSLFILRWIHFLAGIVWIGALYFFNLVNLLYLIKPLLCVISGV